MQKIDGELGDGKDNGMSQKKAQRKCTLTQLTGTQTPRGLTGGLRRANGKMELLEGLVLP